MLFCILTLMNLLYLVGLHFNLKSAIALADNFISLYQVFDGFDLTRIPIQN